MTIDTINLLNQLITEKKDRLSAVNRRLTQLRFEIRNPAADLDALGAEIRELGKETSELVTFIQKAKAKKAEFYKPATM